MRTRLVAGVVDAKGKNVLVAKDIAALPFTPVPGIRLNLGAHPKGPMKGLAVEDQGFVCDIAAVEYKADVPSKFAGGAPTEPVLTLQLATGFGGLDTVETYEKLGFEVIVREEDLDIEETPILPVDEA